MTTTPCPTCGQPAVADVPACPNCGHALTNGAVQRNTEPVQKPSLPPELAGYVFEKMTPEIEALLARLDLEAFRADVREIEETGGRRLDNFIGEIEEIVKRRG